MNVSHHMEFSTLRKGMLDAATSEMTKKSADRKMVLANIGEGGLLIVEDEFGNSITFTSDGSIEDTDIIPASYCKCEAGCECVKRNESAELIKQVKDNVETIELYFSYSFGGGQTVFVRKGDNFEVKPPEKTIKNWYDAFPGRDSIDWELKVIAKLTKLDPRFPYARIDYDSDFGYQGISVLISKVL